MNRMKEVLSDFINIECRNFFKQDPQFFKVRNISQWPTIKL